MMTEHVRITQYCSPRFQGHVSHGFASLMGMIRNQQDDCDPPAHE